MLLGGASSCLPSFAQTSTPKFDPFFTPLFMAITFDDTTIKHLMYTHKVPFQCTESACVVFSGFEICPEKNDMM